MSRKVWSIRSPFYSGCRTIWRAVSNNSTTMPILPGELDAKPSATGRFPSYRRSQNHRTFHLTPFGSLLTLRHWPHPNPLGPHFRDYFAFFFCRISSTRDCTRDDQSLPNFTSALLQVIATGQLTLPKSLVGQIHAQIFRLCACGCGFTACRAHYRLQQAATSAPAEAFPQPDRQLSAAPRFILLFRLAAT